MMAPDQVKSPLLNADFDRLMKLAPVLLLCVYFVGFLVVMGNLGRYGITSLEVFRLQYLVAGVWCVFPGMVLVFLLQVAWTFLSVLVRESKGGGLRVIHVRLYEWKKHTLVLRLFITNVVVIVGSIYLALVDFGILGFSGLLHHVREHWPMLLIMLLFMGLAVLGIWPTNEIISEEERRPIGSSLISVSALNNVSLIGSTCAALVYVALFSQLVYAAIPQRFGGGSPIPVVFVLPDASPSSNTFLIRNGSGPKSITYELILEKENSLIVVSPNDQEHAIEFDRKAIVAMIVLKNK